MLTPNDREDLRWAMQAALLEQTAVLHENKETVKDYVLQEATYEQLLNLCFNPYSSDDVYLEGAFKITVDKDGKPLSVITEHKQLLLIGIDCDLEINNNPKTK